MFAWIDEFDRNTVIEALLDDAEINASSVTDEMLEDMLSSMEDDYIPEYCLKNEWERPLYKRFVPYLSRGSLIDESHWGDVKINYW